jgi:hypothetical protein
VLNYFNDPVIEFFMVMMNVKANFLKSCFFSFLLWNSSLIITLSLIITSLISLLTLTTSSFIKTRIFSLKNFFEYFFST